MSSMGSLYLLITVHMRAVLTVGRSVHPFNGFSSTTSVSQHQKGKAIKPLCTLLQTDNQVAPRHQFFTGQMLFLTPNQQCQNTEGNKQQTQANVCISFALKQLKYHARYTHDSEE